MIGSGQFEKKNVMPTKVGIHCGKKNEYLDSRRVVYDPTGHRPVGSLRPAFAGMTN